MLYTRSDGGSNACTGTLLADADPETRIPYLVTAHHCIPDQALASSIETFWGHRAEACGAVPVRAPERVTGGAELLSVRESHDTVLLRLRWKPPRTSVLADWSATLPAIGTEVVSVHYPHGQTAKVARGRICAHRHCVDVDYCGADAEPDGLHYLAVTWADGITSGGSSGAGAFRDNGELVGVLTGGLSSCAAPTKSDDFGWFDWGFWEIGAGTGSE
ncbi:MAG: serine protease [Chromatiaceae bacterium]|nr:serine protease [Chromatiaceae bacterium]